jgi:LysR family nitrogen assimilation transcriptional regulator
LPPPLTAGLGCIIGTKLFMREQLESNALHSRPIVKPALFRTLFMCELADRPSTFALQAVANIMLRLVREAIRDQKWEATALG